MSSASERKKILVVDDEPIIRVSLKRLLEDEGFEVALAISGDGALALLEKESPDLVITDLIMPGMDGFEMIRTIKERYPSLKVIAMTGYATPETNEKMATAGADGFIKKPFLPVDLLRILE